MRSNRGSSIIPQRSMEVSRNTRRHSIRSRRHIHGTVHSELIRLLRDQEIYEYRLSPANGWSDRNNEPSDRGILAFLLQLRTERLFGNVSNGRIRLKQFETFANNDIAVLSQLRLRAKNELAYGNSIQKSSITVICALYDLDTRKIKGKVVASQR
jgi:hypothetical protein